MKLFKRGKVFYLDFVDTNGQRQRPSTGQTDERLARARAAELMHTNFVDGLGAEERKVLGTHLTLGAILTRTFEERWKEQRGGKERGYQLALLMSDVGHWPLHSVTTPRLKEYAASLLLTKAEGGKGLMPATVNRKLSMLKTAMGIAVENGELQGSPKFPFFTEDNEKERYVSAEEEEKVIAWFAQNVAPADTETMYFRDLFLLLIDTGLRTSEGLGLTPERLIDGGTAIRLPKGTRAKSRLDRTKSGKSRTVPLTPRAQAAAVSLMANPVHRRHDGNWGSLRFGRIMDRVGIPDIGLHTLRHTCASRLVQRGVRLEVVQQWLGHANMKTTQRYAWLAPHNLADAMSVLVPEATSTVLPDDAELAQFRAWKASQASLEKAGVPSHPVSFPLPTA